MSTNLLSSVIAFNIERCDPLFSDLHKCINLCLKFTNHVNVQGSVDTECSNNNFAFQEYSSEGSRLEHRVNWNEETEHRMKGALDSSNIEELNNLSTVLKVSDLLAIYGDSMNE